MTVVKSLQGDPPSFYQSIRPIVLTAGFFGLLPVSRAHRNDPYHLRFSWFSPKTVFCLIVLILLTSVCFLSTKSVLNALLSNGQASAKDMTAVIAGLVFHSSAVFSVAFFINIARQLPALMTSWDLTACRVIKYLPFVSIVSSSGEQTLSKLSVLHYPLRRMVLISSLVMVCAFADRILHDSRYVLVEAMCPSDPSNNRTLSYTECYVKHNADYLLRLLGDNTVVVATLALLVNIFTTASWNFLDLFIMLLSCGLHHNFTRINDYLERTVRTRRRPEEWKIIREDHLALAHLVSSVDSALSMGILYSYAANLISICTQMFLGLRPRNSTILETLYTTVSFLHLVGRTAGVTWTASRIHDAYQMPLKHIHSCSSSSYCLETQRLRAHIIETPACLSGCRFFYVTRSFFLGIVSVVITYEVIFLELK